MLRPRPAARLGRGADLLVRMHVLPRLRRGRARRALPELRRRTGAAADPAGRPAAAPSGLDPAGRQGGGLRARASDRMPRGPSRRGLVPPFIAMDVLRAANAARGRRAFGHPSRSRPARHAGARAGARRGAEGAGDGPHRLYRRARHRAAARRRSPRHYREQYGVAVDPAEVVVTTGSSAAFQLAFLAAFEPGDRVALAAPGYPAYRNILSALGLEPVLIEVGAERALPAEPGTARRSGRRHRRADRRQPRQPDRHDDRRPPNWRGSPRGAASATSGSSRTRSITASPTRRRRRPRARSDATSSSSTRSRNITA